MIVYIFANVEISQLLCVIGLYSLDVMDYFLTVTIIVETKFE